MSIKITLEDLAGLVKMSVPHLMRKFKVDFGNSPAAYIMNLRVQFAKRLLTSKKEIPLKVIASEAGFCDQSHMTRVFQKKFLGKHPSKSDRNTPISCLKIQSPLLFFEY